MFARNIIAFLALLFLSFCIIPTSTSAQDLLDYSTPKVYEIGGISVGGTQYLDEDVLITSSGLSVGDKINVPGDEIPKAIKSLWKQGLFSDVKIYATKVINEVIFLEIKLVERVRLSKYKFAGVRKVEEDDLRDRIDLIRGRIINQNLLSNTRNAIKDYYINKGFLNVEVDIAQAKDETFKNTAVLEINVRRGAKIKINEIIFKGNDAILSRKLEQQMKDTRERTAIRKDAPQRIWRDLKKANIGRTFGELSVVEALQYVDENILRFTPFNTSKFLEDEYQADKNNVIEYYNNNGYRDARIVRDSLYFVDEKTVNLEIDVEEGMQYYFRNIDWKGNSKYSDEQLARRLGIKPGDVYNKALLQSRLFMDPNGQDVSSLYMDDGYLFFNVNPIEKAIVGDSIDLEVNVYEGAQATIDEVIIRGNTKTNEHVVRRELRSLPGSKFSRSDIIRSQREIANLGYFNPEGIQINPIPHPEKGTVDIEYTLEEKPSDQLELSAGWGGNTVVGSVGVSFNNFSLRNMFNRKEWRPLPSGDGQKLSLRLQSTGRQYQSVNASFTEPWLGGRRPNAFTVSVFTSRIFSNHFVADLDRDDRQLQYITGASIGLGRRLTWPDDNFTLQTSINYQHYLLQNSISDFIITNGTSNNLSVSATLARYSLDQPIYPRSGSNISLSVQATPPYASIANKDFSDLSQYDSKKYKWAEYHKWKFKAEWFTALVGNLVLRTSVKTGLMGFYNNNIGHSPFERFRVGGDGISNFTLQGTDIISLRGYEDSEITNTRLQVTETSDNGEDVTRSINVNDPFYAKYTVELRYPLTLNPSSTIYGLAFIEGGNSWSSFRDYNPFEVQRSAGLGLRVFLPMFGTLGFDYGVGFDKSTQPIGNTFWDYITAKGRFSIVLGVEPE